MENNELQQYRKDMLEKTLNTANKFVADCRSAKDPFAPSADGGWNVHQLAAHVWDVDKEAYGLRVRRVLSEDNPVFSNYDSDNWVANVYNPALPLETMLAEFLQRVEEMVSLLKDLPDEAWNRIGKHETYGEFTLQSWVERSLAHIEEHLHSVNQG